MSARCGTGAVQDMLGDLIICLALGLVAKLAYQALAWKRPFTTEEPSLDDGLTRR